MAGLPQLPVELIEYIFSLPDIKDTRTQAALCTTGKFGYSVAAPRLYRCLGSSDSTLRSAERTNIFERQCRALMQRSGLVNHVREINHLLAEENVFDGGGISPAQFEEGINYLTTQHKILEYITLPLRKNVCHIRYLQTSDQLCMTFLLLRCPKIETLILGGFCTSLLSQVILNKTLYNARSLRSGELRSLVDESCSLSIRHLRLSRHPNVVGGTHALDIQPLLAFPSLKTLHVESWTPVDPHSPGHFQDPAQPESSLEELTIESFESPYSELQAVLPFCPNLTSLSIRRQREATNFKRRDWHSIGDLIRSHLPALRYLCLDYVPTLAAPSSRIGRGDSSLVLCAKETFDYSIFNETNLRFGCNFNSTAPATFTIWNGDNTRWIKAENGGDWSLDRETEIEFMVGDLSQRLIERWSEKGVARELEIDFMAGGLSQGLFERWAEKQEQFCQDFLRCIEARVEFEATGNQIDGSITNDFPADHLTVKCARKDAAMSHEVFVRLAECVERKLKEAASERDNIRRGWEALMQIAAAREAQ